MSGQRKDRVKATMVQLSAHNTPQFDWVRSRLPHKAQPVPPVYQPEVAADAVLWAATHYKREHIVGFPAWKAIYGNNVFPSLADKFLAKTGYKNQQTSEPKDPDQPDNLFGSVSKPVGAHGRFDNIAKNRSLFFELSKYRQVVFILLVIVLIILIALINR